jgi:uncharacterized protein (TIGR02996 family)
MATDDALLRAVLADPDDDAPRLIYADWLDEQGNCDRAEFIRVQVALAHNGEDDPRNPQLWQRERELLAAHGVRWAAPLNGLARPLAFRRGFVEEVEVPAAYFLSRGEYLFDAAPVRGARLVRAGLSGPKLAACPTLARLAGLDLNNSHLWPSHLAVLLASPYLTGLRALALTQGSVSLSDVMVLCGSPALGSLTRLELRNNRLYNAGAVLLAECPRLDRLRVLDLRNNGIGAEGGNALAASPHLGGLDLLDLRGNFIDSAAPALRARFGDRLRR